MSITIYLDDDTTELDGYVLTNVEAGQLSDEVDIHIRNEGLTEAKPFLLVMRTLDPSDPGVVVATGVPPQDEMWGRFKVTGYDANGDDTWHPANTSYTSLGAFAGHPVDRIPAGGALYGKFAIKPPGTAIDAAAWTVYPVPIYNENSMPVPPSLTLAMRGVLHGFGDPKRSGVVFKSWDAFIPAAAGTPDDTVYVGAGNWLHAGRYYGKVGETFTFNQNDSAAAALASGQSYWVTFSLGAGVLTDTKGVKGTTPTKPSPPAGELVIGYVRINYDAGGTVIETADIDWLYDPDRGNPGDGGGLNLQISQGQALVNGTYAYWGIQNIPLDDNDTSYVWLLASGQFEATLTDVYPEDTAIPWCVATTSAGAITVIVDRRSYAGGEVIIELGGAMPGSVGSIQTKVVAHSHLYIDDVLYVISDNGGTAGETKLDLHVNAATIYTSHATEDIRPTFAHDAATLTLDNLIHEVTELRRGDVLDFRSVTYPTGGSGAPVSGTCYVICRVP